MPIHDTRCQKCGEIEERFIPLECLGEVQTHSCGGTMERVFFRFPFATIQADVAYESPIDGKPITSMAARKEDMKRAGCIEYDPEMRTDYTRRMERDAAALEAAVDQTVDAEIARMPARKREKLEAEMAGGLDASMERVTPNVKPLTVELPHG